jgi:CubicO group peptidase (beta-lactamase class C family)
MRSSNLFLYLIAAASVLAAPAEAADEAPAPAITGADVGAWLDGFLPFALENGDIAGAVVVVVKDGQILVQRGYGYADVASRRPVHPESTLFRIGSVSKLFTWTAVMQLVETGRLDLDRDINEYLDFEVPAREGEPISLRHLMTHTPGFEEAIKNLITDDPGRLLPLDEYLKRWTPAQIFPPGEVPAYSNYGVSLAGYIVERVSGKPLDDYLDAHLFAPLAMTTATSRQPLPEALAPQMSSAYAAASGPAQPFELVTLAPAGSATASGADMAKFMIAWLGYGQTQGARILERETVQQVFGTRLALVPPLNGMLLGFMEQDRKGRHIVGHGGDSLYFHTSLDLFPDDGVGVFLSMNSTGAAGAAYEIRTALLDNFADRYFPVPDVVPAVDAASAAEHARLMTGVYKASRRAQSSFLSLPYLLSQVEVSLTADGGLRIPALTGFSGKPMRWVETEPFVWQQAGGSERLAARLENGKVTMFSVDAAAPFSIFQPVHWWESSKLLNPLISAAILILVIMTVAWPIAACVRRRYAIPARLDGQARLVYRWLRLGALGLLGACAAWVAVISLLSGNLFAFDDSLDPWLVLLKLATLVVTVGASVLACWNLRLAWKNKRPLVSKAWAVAVCFACLNLMYVAVAFKLLGPALDY